MSKSIIINRPNGYVTLVRSEVESSSEEPLTEHEQIINELYNKIKDLNKDVNYTINKSIISKDVDRIINTNDWMYIARPSPSYKLKTYTESYDCKIKLLDNGACYIEEEDKESFIIYPSAIKYIYFKE